MLNKLRKLQNKKGFTLVELIVVIAIIAILTAVIVPLVSRYTTQATYTSLQSAASSVESQVNAGINSYAMTGKVFPNKWIVGVADADGTPSSITVDGTAYAYTATDGKVKKADGTEVTTDAIGKLVSNIAIGLSTKFPEGAVFGVQVQDGGVVGIVYCPSPAVANAVPQGAIAAVSGYDDAYEITPVGGSALSCGILGTFKANVGKTYSVDATSFKVTFA